MLAKGEIRPDLSRNDDTAARKHGSAACGRGGGGHRSRRQWWMMGHALYLGRGSMRAQWRRRAEARCVGNGGRMVDWSTVRRRPYGVREMRPLLRRPAQGVSPARRCMAQGGEVRLRGVSPHGVKRPRCGNSRRRARVAVAVARRGSMATRRRCAWGEGLLMAAARCGGRRWWPCTLIQAVGGCCAVVK